MIWIERRHIYLVALFLGHLLLIGGIVFLVTNRMERRFLQELKNTQNTLEQIRENELLLAQDLNHARSVLGLQVRTYDFQLKEVQRFSQEKASYSPLFQAVDTILSLKEQQEREALLMRVLRAPEVANLLKSHGLDLKKEKGKLELQKKGVSYFSCSFSKENPFGIESYLGTRFVADSKEPLEPRFSSFLQEQIPLLESHFSRMEQLRTQLLSTCHKPKLQTLASQKGLFLSAEEESNDDVRLRYLLKVEPSLSKLEVGLSYRKGTFFVAKETYQTIDAFEKALERALENTDTRTTTEIRLDTVLAALRTQMKDTGFQRYLQSKKIKISPTERENEEYRFIDLLEEKGSRIGSIGILKIKGEVFLLDKDDVPITSLRMFISSSPVPEKVPIQDKKKSLNSATP